MSQHCARYRLWNDVTPIEVPPVLVSVTRSQVGSSDGVPSGTVRRGGLVNDC